MKIVLNKESIKRVTDAKKEKDVVYIDSQFGDYMVRNVPWLSISTIAEPMLSGRTFDRVYELVAELRESGNGFEVEYSDKQN